MTIIIKSITEWQKLRKQISPTKTIGVVTTMGCLHAGHESLIKQCIKNNDISVVSIFVNPMQFNDPQDYQNYPITIDEDIKKLKAHNVDYLFMPDAQDIYADNYEFKVITESIIANIMEGKTRPGHFNGVLTVLLKLFQLIKPNRVYFGEKDYQQLLLIQQLCQAFFLDIEVVACPTRYEGSGLAMSSRNKLLDTEQKNKAALFAKLFSQSKSVNEIRLALSENDFAIDYIEEYNHRIFVAIKLGNIRLIDNKPI